MKLIFILDYMVDCVHGLIEEIVLTYNSVAYKQYIMLSGLKHFGTRIKDANNLPVGNIKYMTS